jgi:SDR family mycofactocin-dependent oxidoreductase
MSGRIHLVKNRRLAGKTAFITGAARGQGRSHAVLMASEGASIIAVDLCGQIDSVQYPMSTSRDLEQTVAAVEGVGGRICASVADVRDESALRGAFDRGVQAVGPVDIVIANAGIAAQASHERPGAWADVLDVNLTGVFHTVEVAIPSMIENKRGGSIVLTGSTAGLTGASGPTRAGLAYAAAKHGVVGLMRGYANNLAPHSIRVNSVHPTGVATPMIQNQAMREFLDTDPSHHDVAGNALPVPVIEPVDVSYAIVWLVSDEARYVTGVALPVDAGFVNNR